MTDSPQPIRPTTLLDSKLQSRARVRLWVFTVISLHVFVLMTLLIVQGCKREEAPPPPETNVAPIFEPTDSFVQDTNTTMAEPPMAPPVVGTQPPMVVPPYETAPPVPAAQEYVIVKGDTFSGIAKKFGVSVKAIETANPTLDPRKLMPGTKIIIPAPEAAAASPTAPAVTTSGETIHVVQSGDTLISIAKHYGTTVKAIQAANNLTDTRIKVSQKLKIPVKPAADAAPAQ